MPTESVPRVSLESLLAERPHSRGTSIDSLWRDGASIIGPLNLLSDVEPGDRLDLLETLRVIAMSEKSNVDVVARVIESARSDGRVDTTALYSAATFAITQAELMRWVSANPGRVAASPNWMAALPGLGGAIVSVPLVEEALGNLMAVKARLPKDLTRFVQLNPWFTLRFAVQFRRYTGGRRIRLADRAATARAWSHARSLLRPQLPLQWQARHGRGAGRAIDQWSHRFLIRYAGAVKRAHRGDSISPVMAALFSVASAADVANPPTLDAVASWRVLPSAVERDALNLIGLGPTPSSGLEPQISTESAAFPWKSGQAMIPRISWR